MTDSVVPHIVDDKGHVNNCEEDDHDRASDNDYNEDDEGKDKDAVVESTEDTTKQIDSINCSGNPAALADRQYEDIQGNGKSPQNPANYDDCNEDNDDNDKDFDYSGDDDGKCNEEEDDDEDYYDDKDDDYVGSGSVSSGIKTSSKLHLTTPRVIEVLERTGISSRNAAMLFKALIMDEHTKNHDVQDYVLDHNSIRRARIKYRREYAAQVGIYLN